VEWTKDNAGRWKIEEVADSEKVYPCQLVLLAMGFLGPESEVLDTLKVDQDARSNVKTEPGKFATRDRILRNSISAEKFFGQICVLHSKTDKIV
jgi:NADPH-dependent glutamate synthase beta subunit-like oxidoreductase